MAIARIYANACEHKGKNFNSVPKSISDDVAALIEEDGFIINPDGTVEEKTA